MIEQINDIDVYNIEIKQGDSIRECLKHTGIPDLPDIISPISFKMELVDLWTMRSIVNFLANGNVFKNLQMERNFISKILDIHKNKPAVVMGCGPSLNRFNLDFCKDKITFGTNGIGHKYVPNYWIILCSVAWDRHKQILLKNKNNTIPLIGWPVYQCKEFTKFYYRPYNSVGLSKYEIYTGATAGFTGVALAYIMGCNPIYVTGIDNNFTKATPTHFYGTESYPKWKLVERIVRSSFQKANEITKRNGVKLINVSPISTLNFLEFQSV